MEDENGAGPNTPAGEPADDFFSSWDKPAIKRPSNPPSRSGTPGINRTASPFLSANQNGNVARPKSPLIPSSTSDAAPAPPTARAISSSAVRKPPVTNKPKANILGAKKTKLGAKKVDSSALDFDEAEKKAREEAERKERLGYDPDETTTSEAQIVASQPDTGATTIHQPTPVSPAARGNSFGSTGQPRPRGDSEVERLGMGVRKLGFGQVGGGGGGASKSASASRGIGFGAVSKPAVQGTRVPHLVAADYHILTSTPPFTDDSERYAREKFGTQKGISSDEFFGRNNFDPSAASEAKSRLQGFEGATSISSNAYFGRSEEEEIPGGVEQYGDLETAAKDFVRRFGITAGDDLENLTGMLGEGAQRLSGAVRDYLNG